MTASVCFLQDVYSSLSPADPHSQFLFLSTHSDSKHLPPLLLRKEEAGGGRPGWLGETDRGQISTATCSR